jgi:hypothetical protein
MYHTCSYDGSDIGGLCDVDTITAEEYRHFRVSNNLRFWQTRRNHLVYRVTKRKGVGYGYKPRYVSTVPLVNLAGVGSQLSMVEQLRSRPFLPMPLQEIRCDEIGTVRLEDLLRVVTKATHFPTAVLPTGALKG